MKTGTNTLPAPMRVLPHGGFTLKVSPTGWINIIQGDEDNEPDPIRVILSPREAGELLKALPQFVEAAAELFRGSRADL